MYQEKIKQVLIREHKDQPTLIQKESYDAIRNGASLVGLAKTGTVRHWLMHFLVWKKHSQVMLTAW